MSSQSGSEYNNSRRVNRTKRTKAEPIPQKRSRRSNRKLDGDDSQNALPANIPATDSDQLIIYHSFELQVTKAIIQIPMYLFRKPKMQKQTWIRVGDTLLSLQITNNDLNQLIINARIKTQQNSKPGTRMQSPIELEDQAVMKNMQGQQEEEDEIAQECNYLVWGKVYWVGAHEICNKTIKHSPKSLNSGNFQEIVKVKSKDVNSDIFVILNTKKKLECVNEHNGLINQGNTCYMNSYLQMLSHISQFKNLVFQASLVDENKFPATLQLLFHKLDNEQKPVSAEQLAKSFGWSKKDTNIQQDAEEFSCLFYDALERKLQEACPNPKHMTMSEMFQGKLRNMITCLDVGKAFFNISLSLSNNLTNSLNDYVAEQELSGDNLYNTEYFGPQRAKKSVQFLSVPPIIMVQLKRFQFNYINNKNQKILHHFEYPEAIDFSKWQVCSKDACDYELYAVLVHEGSKAESGHYYAYVNIFDQWFRFNDQEVSRASKLQVFDYNFGGEIDVVEFDAREFKVFNRKIVSNSTAYMLVYVKTDLKEKLLHSDPIYPEWLEEHQILKQGERQEIRSRKNFYHDVQVLDWDTHFQNTIGDFLGIIPKDFQEPVGKIIPRIHKTDRIEQWVKPYNEKGLGCYLYLVTIQKIEYQTLINMQHRKCPFQDIARQPNCPIMIINLPIIAKSDSMLYFIKIAYSQAMMDEQEDGYQMRIKFHTVLEINRNSKNSELLAKLRAIYAEPGFNLKFYFEEKKDLTEIKDDRNLIKTPQMQRNILGIIIVEKIAQDLKFKMGNQIMKWYNDIKNYVGIKIKSEDGKYEFHCEMDQNRSVESLREYIFSQKLDQSQIYSSSDNIVLKGKAKKTAKNYIQITNAKTIRDLIKNCDKQNIIVFGFSNLKAEERVNQMQIKFMYRFPDFTFSDTFHVILDRKLQKQSLDIYQRISEHHEVQSYKKIQQLFGIRLFLFSKDKNVINDIVFQNGYVHGKGEVAQVLQKQKGSHLVVEGFPVPTIEQSICPILLHHRSQSDEKVGIPRYFQFARTTKLTKVYDYILQLIKDEYFEWQDKKIKCNPMKTIVYAYYKDFYKGIELADEITLQIQEQDRFEKQSKKKNNMEAEGQEKDKDNEKDKDSQRDLQKDKEERNGEIIDENKIKEIHIVEESEQEKLNGQNGDNHHSKQQVPQSKKGCIGKIKPWERTIETSFPKAKLLKIMVRHTYLVKSQIVMKINVE